MEVTAMRSILIHDIYILMGEIIIKIRPFAAVAIVTVLILEVETYSIYLLFYIFMYHNSNVILILTLDC